MTFQPEPLAELLHHLDNDGYAFTAITPASHARVLSRRRGAMAADLRDVFGWSLPFAAGFLPSDVEGLLDEGGALAREGGMLRSRIRIASLDGRLFAHSAYPTEAADSVFFGPDTYRFARFIEGAAADLEPPTRIVDLGAGAGPGGIVASALLEPEELLLVDVNDAALALAEANALAAGIEAVTVHGSLDAVEGPIDLLVANPPFIADPAGRAYRDGGDGLGTAVTLDWARAGIARLAPGGTMLLYSGSPVVGGEDRLLGALSELADTAGATLRYEEIDPDIFGEELGGEPYAAAGVERIAAVGAILRRD